MSRGNAFGRIAREAARRPFLVVALFAVLVAGGVAGALTLKASASTETLVEAGSDSFEATEEYKQKFGDEAIVVLVRGNLQRTVLTSDLGRLLSLEGCLSGKNPPAALNQLPPVCRQIAATRSVGAVYGPATFLNTATVQLRQTVAARQAAAQAAADRAARDAETVGRRRGVPRATRQELAAAAREGVLERFKQETLMLAARYGITALPAIDDPSFVSALVFDTARGVNVPKARFAYLFPSGEAAVVQVRLRPDLSEEDRARSIDLVRRAVAEPVFAPQQGARYVVTGVPVIEDDLAREVQGAALELFLAALIVMIVVLPLVFRSSLRLLPLVLAVGAAAITFGALALVGGSLTMASIAAVPVLIGLSVDYAIQYQARVDEELDAAADPSGGPDGEPGDGGEPAVVDESAVRAASVGGPVIATAALASALGFLVLLLSPVPMVRGFGVLVVLGVGLALLAALTVGTSVLVRLRPRSRPRRSRGTRLAGLRPVRRAGERLSDAGGAVGGWVRGAVRSGLRLATTRPQQVLAVGIGLAVLGLVADTQTRVISDVRELVPEDMSALRDVRALTESTGVAGEVDVTVTADDLLRPEVVSWMASFRRDALAAHGYRPGRSCVDPRNTPELCPGFSLTDLLGGGRAGAVDAQALLDAVPRYFSQAVISDDRRTANLAFGIRLLPLDRQQEIVEDLRERLESAPPGVTARVAGAPVLVAEGNASLASPWRRLATLIFGLAAVFAVLLAVRRRFEAAAVPLAPIAMATGWSALVLFLLRIPLNPLSAALAGLVIAISTEFAVLLSARYAEERGAGFEPAEALRRTFDSTGAAVLASGATAIAGFAALTISDIRMLRDFGIVTVVDLTVSLIGVMLVLPAALVWAEQHGPIHAADLHPRHWRGALRGIPVGPRSLARAVRSRVGPALRRRSRTEA